MAERGRKALVPRHPRQSGPLPIKPLCSGQPLGPPVDPAAVEIGAPEAPFLLPVTLPQAQTQCSPRQDRTVAIGLHREMGKRIFANGLPARRLKRGLAARLNRGRKILSGDGVIDQNGLPGGQRRFAQALFEPVGRIAARDFGAMDGG